MSIIGSGDPVPLSAEQIAAGLQLAGFDSAACVSCLVWDICVTMDQEVQYIWSQRWSLINFVYFVVRYLPAFLLLSTFPIGSTRPPGISYSDHDCYIWQLYQLVATMFIFMAVEYVLLLRVEALYKERRHIVLLLRSLFLAEIVCMSIGIGLTMPGFRFDDRCSITITPTTSIIFGVVTPVFQTILFIMTFVKFVQGVRQGWGRIPLADLIMRDGTWAFFLIEALLCGNGVMYLSVPYPNTPLLYSWLLSGFSFAGYRMILNLRRVGARSDITQQNDSAGICFASESGGESFQLDSIIHPVRGPMETFRSDV